MQLYVHGQSRLVHCLIQISHRELVKYEVFAVSTMRKRFRTAMAFEA